MDNNEYITGWVYKKGELARRRLDNFTIGISVVISLVICLFFVLPIAELDPTIKSKIGNWIFFFSFIMLAVGVYFLLRFLFVSLFVVFKKISGVGEEEIIFTNKKITSTKRTWQLNDGMKRLTSVKFVNDAKARMLIFRGIEQRPGKSPDIYNVELPVPREEIKNAEKVMAYFRERLPGKSN